MSSVLSKVLIDSSRQSPFFFFLATVRIRPFFGRPFFCVFFPKVRSSLFLVASGNLYSVHGIKSPIYWFITRDCYG